ncbi:myo-inositol-1(or 4)-monophosphatase [Candidatus Blochmanniella floridana]|uniref:Inositol-1-monophosphatase n=1 Tax=Blochmanniella floridana TaxID=203907 RepID=Q7VRR5_BLOFL|nr:myo-inositol-1(or 4)-monophosphatase [Candidatus Blochmannia floridanus]
MHPMLNVAIIAIRKGGNFLIKQYEFLGRNYTELSSDHIKTLLSKIRAESNQIITTIIKKFYPLHIIIDIKNYSNTSTLQNNNIYWIIESIDNDINFIKQFPFFVLSITIKHHTNIKIGVIYDPIHNELFSACRGKGAQFNGYRIRPHHHKNILQTFNKIILSIVNMNINHTFDINISNTLNNFHKKYNITIDLRCTGSLMLDLVYAAINRIDGCYIMYYHNTIKLASSFLIIQESGGLITYLDKNKKDNDQNSKHIIVGNPKIIKFILPLIKKF